MAVLNCQVHISYFSPLLVLILFLFFLPLLTPGTSSQVSDGAAAVLLASREAAQALNLPVFGVLVSYAVVGVPPSIMGVGPAYAIPEALKKAGKCC